MSEEYLWDRSGEPDPDVEPLEELLGTLAFAPHVEGPLLRLPVRPELAPRPARGYGRVLVVALLSAAATLVLVWGWQQAHVQLSPQSQDTQPNPVAAPPAPWSEPPPSEAPAPLMSVDPLETTSRTDVVESPKEPAIEPPPTEEDSGVAAEVRRQLAEAKAEPEAEAEAPSTAGPSSTAPLPDKPSTSDIKKAFTGVMPELKACVGPLTGGTPGARVRIKVSVVGATGRVRSARVLNKDLTSAFAACVEHTVKEARFTRFTREFFGLVYTLRL